MYKKVTAAVIAAQIEKLSKVRSEQPEHDAETKPSWLIADAQIAVLNGDKVQSDFAEGDAVCMDETHHTWIAAGEAEAFLSGDRKENLI